VVSSSSRRVVSSSISHVWQLAVWYYSDECQLSDEVIRLPCATGGACAGAGRAQVALVK